MPSPSFPFHATLGVQLPNGSSIRGSWDTVRQIAPWTIEHVSFAVTTSEDPASSERLLDVKFRETGNENYQTMLGSAVNSSDSVRLAGRNEAAQKFRDQDNRERKEVEKYYESSPLKAQLDQDKRLTESRQVELAIGSGIVTGSLQVKCSAESVTHFFKLFDEFRIGNIEGDSCEPTTVMIDFKMYEEGPACMSVCIGSRDRHLLREVITAVEKVLGPDIGYKYKLGVIRHLGFRHGNSRCKKFRPVHGNGKVFFCQKRTGETPTDFVHRVNSKLENCGI